MGIIKVSIIIVLYVILMIFFNFKETFYKVNGYYVFNDCSGVATHLDIQDNSAYFEFWKRLWIYQDNSGLIF